MRRVLVTGSRDWEDEVAVFDALTEQLNEDFEHHIVVVHGHCPTGADAIADKFCKANEGNRFCTVDVERHPADWSLGKKAGPLRNQEMVDLGADICLAFMLPGSRGTRHCVSAARRAGIEVELATAWRKTL